MKKDNRIKSYNVKLKDGKVFVASDLHFPYQDNKAIECFLKEVESKKPDMVVLNGDLLDFYRLSRFTKDPSGKDPAEEIEMCREFLHRLRSITDVPIYYTIGNHETRLEKYILDQAPMIACLMDNVFQVIKTEDIGVIGCSRLTINDNFVFEHGTRLGSKTGLSAIKELEAHYLSGATGHCFSEDVEVLTPGGWKRIIDVNIGNQVGTYNKQTGKFEFNSILDKFVYDNYNELYHIKNSCIDIMTTDKHGFIGYDNHNNLKEFTAEDIKNINRIRIPLACQGVNDDGLDIDNDSIRLLVNISADASIEDNSFRFHLKKERKIKHLIDLLDRLNFDYSVHSQKNNTTKIRISAKYSLPIIKEYFTKGKKLPEVLKFANKEQAKVILDEYSITDGSKNSDARNSYQIHTNKKEEIDILQTLFVKNGYRTSYIHRESGYVLTVNTRDSINISKNNVSIVPYKGKVSCVSVGNGTLVVRSKGKTIITQNTHRLARYSTRKSGKRFTWLETGCLCDLSPEYMIDPDWEQGFGIIEFKSGRLKNATVVSIENGEII